MKVNYNDSVKLKNLDSNSIEVYILQQPQIVYRPLIVNSYNKKRYKEETHYDSKIDDNILYTDSPLGKELLGKSEGDYIEYKVFENIFHYKILEIRS